MKIDETTHLISETISALMVIADEDSKQNNFTSSADIIEMLIITKTILKNNLTNLPFNTFKSDPFLNRHFEYTNKECVDTINTQFVSAESKQPFSVYAIFKSRVIPAILQTFRKVQAAEFIDVYFEYILTTSTDRSFTVQEAYSHIMKTTKQHMICDRLSTIQKVVAKLTNKQNS